MGVKWDMPEEEWDPSAFSIWSSHEPTCGADSRKLPSLLDNRIKAAIRDCERTMDKDKKKEINNLMWMKTLPPKGQPHDTVEQLVWNPRVLASRGFSPEALRGYGSPMIFAAIPGSSRVLHHAWYLPGVGHLFIVNHGPVIVMTFPFLAALNRGASCETIVQWLCDLSPKLLKDFSDKNVSLVSLEDGASAWVPYGFAVILVIPASNKVNSCVLGVPYTNANLAKLYPHFGQLAAFLEKHTAAAANFGSPPWVREAGNFSEWLRSVMSTPAPPARELQLPQTPVIQAIEDQSQPNTQTAGEEDLEKKNLTASPSQTSSPKQT